MLLRKEGADRNDSSVMRIAPRNKKTPGVPLYGALLLLGKSKTICADTCENRKNVL